MANLIRWGRRSPALTLRREVDDLLDEFVSPRSLRRQVERMFDDWPAPQGMRRALDRIFEDFAPYRSLQRELDRVFEDFASTGSLWSERGERGEQAEWTPNIEFAELDDAYVVTAEVPGVREQDLNVKIDDNR